MQYLSTLRNWFELLTFIRIIDIRGWQELGMETTVRMSVATVLDQGLMSRPQDFSLQDQNERPGFRTWKDKRHKAELLAHTKVLSHASIQPCTKLVCIGLVHSYRYE